MVINILNSDFQWLEEVESYIGELVDEGPLTNAERKWVHLKTSITEEIEKIVGGRPNIRVHFSDYSDLAPWETDLTGEKRGYIRHISLEYDGQPLLIARSIAQPDEAGEVFLGSLNARPLGTLLFEERDWKRSKNILAIRTFSDVYGRACFWENKKLGVSLIVEEFFLPALTFYNRS